MEPIQFWSDEMLTLEEQFIEASLPHLEKMIAGNRQLLHDIQAEKARRGAKVVAA